MIKSHPSVAAYRHLLACCYRDLPVSPPGPRGRPPSTSVDKAIEILEQLVADFPDVPEYRFDLGKTYARPDSPDQSLSAAAEKRLRKSLSILEKLVAENPNVPEYTASQVQSLYLLANCCDTLAGRTRRKRCFEKRSPSNRRWSSSIPPQIPTLSGMRYCRSHWPNSFPIADRTKEARTLLESAVADLNQLLPSEPQAAYLHEHPRPLLQELVGRSEARGRRATGGRDVAPRSRASCPAVSRVAHESAIDTDACSVAGRYARRRRNTHHTCWLFQKNLWSSDSESLPSRSGDAAHCLRRKEAPGLATLSARIPQSVGDYRMIRDRPRGNGRGL